MWVRLGTAWVWFCGYDWVWWCGERAFISRLSSWGRWRCGASSHLSQLMHTFKTHTGKQSFTNGQPKRKTNKQTRRYKDMQIHGQWKTSPLQRNILALISRGCKKEIRGQFRWLLTKRCKKHKMRSWKTTVTDKLSKAKVGKKLLHHKQTDKRCEEGRGWQMYTGWNKHTGWHMYRQQCDTCSCSCIP